MNDYEVPVLIVDIHIYVDKHWDMTMRKILPFINGVNSVKKISNLSFINLKYVRLAVQHLIYYGCAQLVDIFQFMNVYRITHKVNEFMESLELQEGVDLR